jgi:hypothetical protein
MREFRSSGSVRGVPSNGHPYRDKGAKSHSRGIIKLFSILPSVQRDCSLKAILNSVPRRKIERDHGSPS